MQPDYWRQRWTENRIGFHQDRPTPLLLQHWPALGVAPGSRVFVPLAGKSLDMLWLAQQGYDVLGAELSQLAVEQFFAENDLQTDTFETRYGHHYRADIGERAIELICGDAFALDAEILAGCAAALDRAALIALPQNLRRRYAETLYARLPTGCRTLLITLEYPPLEKQGPPFTVDESEVRDLYAQGWEIELLERSDILAEQPAFVAEGVTALDTCVYRLIRHPA